MTFHPTSHISRAQGRLGRSQAVVAQPGLLRGKVVSIYPGRLEADVALPEGGMLWRVPIVTDISGARGGSVYLPTPTQLAPLPTAYGTQDSYAPDGDGSYYCFIAFRRDDPARPIIVAWQPPQVNQILFAPLGVQVARHESDSYAVYWPEEPRTPQGATYDGATGTVMSEFEWTHASGLYLRVGAGRTHRDLTGQNVQQSWAVRGTANANAAPGVAGPKTADYRDLTLKHPSGTTLSVSGTPGHFDTTLGPSAARTINGVPVLSTATAVTGSYSTLTTWTTLSGLSLSVTPTVNTNLLIRLSGSINGTCDVTFGIQIGGVDTKIGRLVLTAGAHGMVAGALPAGPYNATTAIAARCFINAGSFAISADDRLTLEVLPAT